MIFGNELKVIQVECKFLKLRVKKKVKQVSKRIKTDVLKLMTDRKSFKANLDC